MKIPKTLTLIYLVTFTSIVHAQKAKLKLADIEKFKSSSVKLVRFEAPKLYVMTPKDAVGEGLVAKITKSNEANGKITKIRYYPDRLLQKKLDSLLRLEGLVGQLSAMEEPMEFIMPKELKNTSRYNDYEEDYIFEIYVANGLTWAASYTGLNWKKYWLTLGAELRIYSVSNATLLHKDYAYLGGLNDSRLKFKLEELENEAPQKIQKMVDIAALEIVKKWIEKIQKVSK